MYEEFQLCPTPLHMLRGLKAFKPISIIPKSASFTAVIGRSLLPQPPAVVALSKGLYLQLGIGVNAIIVGNETSKTRAILGPMVAHWTSVYLCCIRIIRYLNMCSMTPRRPDLLDLPSFRRQATYRK